MLFKDLVQKFSLQQRIRSPLSHRRQAPRSLIPQILFRTLHLRERLQFFQPRERVVQVKGYFILQDYLNLKSEDESQESSHLQSSKSTCFPHSSKESWRSMTTQSNCDQSEADRELQLLQDVRLQEWYQGDLQGYPEQEVKEAIKKELISLSSAGHEVYDPVSLNLLSSEDQAKIIESRWVIGPRSGQLKARFVGKGYFQVIDKESNYAHTPQATTLKVILLMSQIHRWSLLCVRCGFSVSQYAG